MISKVVIRRFKRFDEVTFDLPGHIVLAGPNNTGKTTALQAIAAWGSALDRWKRLNAFQRYGGAYTRAPFGRRDFSAVPQRSFELLWNERDYRGSIEVEVRGVEGWAITM
jgi:predicted ATPase